MQEVIPLSYRYKIVTKTSSWSSQGIVLRATQNNMRTKNCTLELLGFLRDSGPSS